MATRPLTRRKHPITIHLTTEERDMLLAHGEASACSVVALADFVSSVRPLKTGFTSFFEDCSSLFCRQQYSTIALGDDAARRGLRSVALVRQPWH